MRQKRLQGSHFANDVQARGLNDLVYSGVVDPCLSKAVIYDELPLVHQLMHDNKHPHGNMAVLIGAPEFGQGINKPELRKKSGDVLTRTYETGGVRWDGVRGIPPGTIVDQGDDQSLLSAISMNVTVGDVMHRGLIGCRRDTPIREVTKLMLEHHIHAVVVTDDSDRPIGVVSQTDIVMASQTRTRTELLSITANDVMTHSCLTCEATAKLTDAISIMTRNRLHRLVVVEKQGNASKAIGVISMTDVLGKYVADK
jgi:crotonyl-CoA carboxylase/reductase